MVTYEWKLEHVHHAAGSKTAPTPITGTIEAANMWKALAAVMENHNLRTEDYKKTAMLPYWYKRCGIVREPRYQRGKWLATDNVIIYDLQAEAERRKVEAQRERWNAA